MTVNLLGLCLHFPNTRSFNLILGNISAVFLTCMSFFPDSGTRTYGRRVIFELIRSFVHCLMTVVLCDDSNILFSSS